MEFRYSEATVRNMVAIGEIPSSPNGELETFGIDVLKSLLPLRIGNINSKTGEDENDYTLIHKCIEWTQSIRAKQKAKRDRIIFKLSMLGWSTREIAEVTGIGKSQVSELSSNGEIAKIGQSLSDWLSQGKTVEEAAEKLEIDATLAWAIHLQNKSDENRTLYAKCV